MRRSPPPDTWPSAIRSRCCRYAVDAGRRELTKIERIERISEGALMKDFAGKVAVVTGAASGIGRALAQRFARERMKVVLADVEAAALADTERELRAGGAAVLAVPTDVANAADVETLAQRTLATFGA